MAGKPRYSGDMRERLSQLLIKDPAGGVPALFAGRRTGFSQSARVALRKACDLLGLQPGDEVLAPAYNCGSELDPLHQAGLVITLYPVGRDTRIDPEAVERRISARTRAIYLTHYFGVLHSESQALRALADRHGLALIEDCALSLLSGAHPVAGWTGDVAVFCFYKFFPTLAGGALVLNSDRIDGHPSFSASPPQAQARYHLAKFVPGVPALLRGRHLLADRLGMERATQYSGLPDMPRSYYFDPHLIDTRIRPIDLRGLRSFDVAAAIAARRANYRAYLDLLADVPGARPLFPNLAAETCPLAMPVLVDNRDTLAAALRARGIAATPWWAGYNRHLDFSGHEAARYLKDNVLALPVHQDLGVRAPAHVVGTLRQLIGSG